MPHPARDYAANERQRLLLSSSQVRCKRSSACVAVTVAQLYVQPLTRSARRLCYNQPAALQTAHGVQLYGQATQYQRLFSRLQ